MEEATFASLGSSQPAIYPSTHPCGRVWKWSIQYTIVYPKIAFLVGKWRRIIGFWGTQCSDKPMYCIYASKNIGHYNAMMQYNIIQWQQWMWCLCACMRPATWCIHLLMCIERLSLFVWFSGSGYTGTRASQGTMVAKGEEAFPCQCLKVSLLVQAWSFSECSQTWYTWKTLKNIDSNRSNRHWNILKQFGRLWWTAARQAADIKGLD